MRLRRIAGRASARPASGLWLSESQVSAASCSSICLCLIGWGRFQYLQKPDPQIMSAALGHSLTIGKWANWVQSTAVLSNSEWLSIDTTIQGSALFQQFKYWRQ